VTGPGHPAQHAGEVLAVEPRPRGDDVEHTSDAAPFARVHEIETALASYRNLPVRSHANEAITLGALVLLESPGQGRCVFLGPDAAGLTVTVENQEVLVISPRSPLGRALLGSREGGDAEILVQGRPHRYSVVAVS